MAVFVLQQMEQAFHLTAWTQKISAFLQHPSSSLLAQELL